jgi:HD superfamily phosphodiesterase
MDLSETIRSAENQYKQILEEYFVSVYNENVLPSHGLDHHRRVWSYAKEILSLLPSEDERFTGLAPKLIVACYLHDIGMSVDQGERHGKQSRIFCSRFLTLNKLAESRWEDVLEAIENHDKKDYEDDNAENDLLTILSVADDLDAFGYIGIYRYLEIYLLRRTDPKKIGYLIRENAETRFENFEETFGSLRPLVKKHQHRFNIIDSFFGKYNEQLVSYHFGTARPNGYCGILELILNMIINNQSLAQLFAEMNLYKNDTIITSYLEGLKSEIE